MSGHLFRYKHDMLTVLFYALCVVEQRICLTCDPVNALPEQSSGCLFRRSSAEIAGIIDLFCF